MPFDSLSPADAIVVILKTVLGATSVQFGAPLSIGPKVGAYITAGHQPGGIKAQGRVYRDAHYFVDLAYRISDSVPQVSDAERTLMAALDALNVAINADKTLGGTCEDATLETGLADAPEYRVRSGPEFREYPVVVICRQYDSFNPTP